MLLYLFSAVFLSMASAQRYASEYTTPVPILKQINRHNDDGSYSYGYEAADGSFKIESKYPNGEVYGKYGYLDDQGKLREIEYGASRRGFEPAGNEINVAPPTLTNNYPPPPLSPNQEDDGQYREDPSVYYKNDPYANTNNQKAYEQPKYTQPVYQQPAYQEPDYNYQEPVYRPRQPIVKHGFQTSQPSYQPTYQPSYQQPSYQPSYQPAYQPPTPAYNNYNNYNAYPSHPNTNVDYFSGSYSVQY